MSNLLKLFPLTNYWVKNEKDHNMFEVILIIDIMLYVILIEILVYNFILN